MNYTRVLTIAGSDSGGGAGIQADLKSITVLGGYGLSVVTGLTAQNTLGVQGVWPSSPRAVRAQLEAVLGDIGVDAIKIGALFCADLVHVVADVLRQAPHIPVVLDPVLVAKSGDDLLTSDGIACMTQQLLPLVTVVTPNMPEAARLTGHLANSAADMEVVGHALLDLGAQAALVKGGHVPTETVCNDVLLHLVNNHCQVQWYTGERIHTRNTHGTGCTLASALAVFLAKGLPLPLAVEHAKTYVQQAIARGAAYELGQGHGPVHHAHPWW